MNHGLGWLGDVTWCHCNLEHSWILMHPKATSDYPHAQAPFVAASCPFIASKYIQRVEKWTPIGALVFIWMSFAPMKSSLEHICLDSYACKHFLSLSGSPAAFPREHHIAHDGSCDMHFHTVLIGAVQHLGSSKSVCQRALRMEENISWWLEHQQRSDSTTQSLCRAERDTCSWAERDGQRNLISAKRKSSFAVWTSLINNSHPASFHFRQAALNFKPLKPHLA